MIHYNINTPSQKDDDRTDFLEASYYKLFCFFPPLLPLPPPPRMYCYPEVGGRPMKPSRGCLNREHKTHIGSIWKQRGLGHSGACQMTTHLWDLSWRDAGRCWLSVFTLLVSHSGATVSMHKIHQMLIQDRYLLSIRLPHLITLYML